MLNNDADQIEIDIFQAKEMVAKKNKLEILFENLGFKEIILEGYFSDEAVRLVAALSDPATQDESVQKAMVNDMRAIGAFQFYLRSILSAGLSAEASLSSYEKEQEVIAEEFELNG